MEPVNTVMTHHNRENGSCFSHYQCIIFRFSVVILQHSALNIRLPPPSPAEGRKLTHGINIAQFITRLYRHCRSLLNPTGNHLGTLTFLKF